MTLTALKPVTARVIEPPAYDNRRIAHRWAWIRDNAEALKARYEALGRELPDEDDSYLGAHWKAEEFLAFQLAQYDLALRRHQEGR